MKNPVCKELLTFHLLRLEIPAGYTLEKKKGIIEMIMSLVSLENLASRL